MSRPLVATVLLAAALAGDAARDQDARPAPTFDEVIRMRVVYTVTGTGWPSGPSREGAPS